MKIRALAFSLAFIAAIPAAAQIGGEKASSFLKAVREGDGNKAIELIDANGSTVVSARGEGGETALNIVAQRRDSTWLGYLLGRGADPNAGDNRGETALLIASRLGWADGARTLVEHGARVDGANRSGETPLIVAIQARQSEVARYLLGQGADPDRRDHAAGYSAREYAKRDNRSTELIRLIETTKPALKIKAGPIIQ